jgi:hypothetical protein
MTGKVFYQKYTATKLVEWYGFGKAEKPWPLDLVGIALETNLGTIFIEKLSFDGKDISFSGSWPIKDPFT